MLAPFIPDPKRPQPCRLTNLDNEFELMRPRLVEIELVFRDGTVSPLQYAVQQKCNVPICRGGPDEDEKLLKCLADAEKNNCFKICREP